MPVSREPTRRRGLLRRHPRVVGAALVVVLLVGAVAALGGFARTADAPQVVRPGTEVDATPLVVTLDRAVATYEVADRQAEPGHAYVVLEGTIALSGDEPVSSTVVANTFGIDLDRTYDGFGGVEDEAEPTVRVAGDGSSLLGLGPGLTYDVLLVYEVDEAAVPSFVDVTVLRHVRRPSSFDRTPGWFDAAPHVGTTLSVAPLPDERPEDEVL